MLSEKAMVIYLIAGLIKKISVFKVSYYPEPVSQLQITVFLKRLYIMMTLFAKINATYTCKLVSETKSDSGKEDALKKLLKILKKYLILARKATATVLNKKD